MYECKCGVASSRMSFVAHRDAARVRAVEAVALAAVAAVAAAASSCSSRCWAVALVRLLLERVIGGLAREGCFLVVVFLIAVVGAKHLLRDVDLAGAALSAFPLPRLLVVVVVVEAVGAAVVVVGIVDRAVIDDGAATVVSDGGACCCGGGGCCRLRDAMPRVPRSLPSTDDTEPPCDS